MHKSQMSIYSSKLKGLLNKQLDKDKLNGNLQGVHKSKLFVVEQFCQNKISGVKSISSPKLKGLSYKRLDRDEMNAIGSCICN